KLTRLGALERSGKIDARSMPAAVVSNQGGSLTVASEPTGCELFVGGERASAPTPATVPLEGGKETLVAVVCPGGLPRYTQWVMAAPGQAVRLKIRLFDER